MTINLVCSTACIDYDAGMSIRVEFFGIARQRAGVPAIEVDASDATLGCVLSDLLQRLPEFGRECFIDGRLAASLTTNLDGQRFVSDPATPIRDGQSLLILSVDAGG